MRAIFRPSTANGTVSAPPSKSMAHRLLMCAGLSCCMRDNPVSSNRGDTASGVNYPLSGVYDEKLRIFRIGDSEISNLDLSEDIKATINCINALSIFASQESGTGYRNDPVIFDCGESGSTLRFFIPAALLFDRPSVFTGRGRLCERPLSVYEDICRERNILLERKDDTISVKGKLSPGEYEIPGNISSQFISGLLFAFPLLDGDSTIKLIPPVESRPYIDMTLKALSVFGVTAEFTDEFTISVPGSQRYSAKKVSVEGDHSNAAFLDAFNLAGGNVTVSGLDPCSLQGDKIYREYFRMLEDPGSIIDISDFPDLGPVLIAAASVKRGAVLTGTRRLAIKESDRGAAMKEELLKFGKEIIINENSIEIPPGEMHCPKQDLSGHNDHRIVMALSLPASVFGGTIEGAEAVTKSFPDYFEKIKKLGIDVMTGQ